MHFAPFTGILNFRLLMSRIMHILNHSISLDMRIRGWFGFFMDQAGVLPVQGGDRTIRYLFSSAKRVRFVIVDLLL